MVYYLKLYVTTFIGFLAIDFVWLGFAARKFYRKHFEDNHLDDLLADSPNWWAAFFFYAIFVAGLIVFVVNPSLQARSLTKAVLLGAFFGLVTYATYDLTNHATVKNWPGIVTVVDLCWGTVLAASVGGIGYMAGRWLEGP